MTPEPDDVRNPFLAILSRHSTVAARIAFVLVVMLGIGALGLLLVKGTEKFRPKPTGLFRR